MPDVYKFADDNDGINLESILNSVKSERFSKIEDGNESDVKFEKIGSFFDLVRSSVQIDEAIQGTDGVTQNELYDETKENLEIDADILLAQSDVNRPSGEHEQIRDEGDRVEEFAQEPDLVQNPVPREDQTKGQDRDQRDTKIRETNDRFEEKLAEEYSRGYEEAAALFKKDEADRKANFQQLTELVLGVSNDLTTVMEAYLAQKVKEVSHRFLGQKIDSIPKDFENEIRKAATSIDEFANQIVVEVCSADLFALREAGCIGPSEFYFLENSEFERGEFEVKINKSSYVQMLTD